MDIAEAVGTRVRAQVFDPVGAIRHIVEQRDQHARMKSGVDEVIHFDQHRRGNHQRLGGLLDQAPTGPVVGIVAIQGSVQRARVQDQRQGRGTGRSIAVWRNS